MAIYEFAQGLRRRGHEVHLVHVHDFLGEQVGSVDEIGWYEFDSDIEHHFPDRLDDGALPKPDFTFCFDPRMPDDGSLPLMFVQAFKAFRDDIEEYIFRAPCPKICIARWLTDVVKHYGATEAQAVHIPYGLRHEKYRTIRPVEERAPRVSMLYHWFPIKGSSYGIEALEMVKARRPELEVTVFAVDVPAQELPGWMTFLRNPSQDELVEEVYNGSRIFLWPSVLEGFGFPAIEAMACGAALVTTPNGGSADFARHDETALVAKSKNAQSLADNIERFLVDDELRMRIARGGQEFVQRFDWDVSAEMLESFLTRYAASPDTYR